MKRTYRYRVYLKTSQATNCENQFSMCRHLYNWSLTERIEAYQQEKRTVTYYDQQNALPKLKQNKPWYKGIYSLSLQDVLRRLDDAYQKFFKQGAGFPNYKKRGQWNSLTYADFRKRPEDGHIDIPKIGKVKLKYHREIPKDAEIKTLTLTKEGSKWFICFSLEMPNPAESKQKPTKVLGIDLGVNHLVYSTQNHQEEAPKSLQTRYKDLKRLQRKLSRQTKRTKEYQKTLKDLQKAHYRVRCKRIGYLYRVCERLFDGIDLIIHEDLNIKEMVKRPLPKKDEQTGEYLPNGASRKKGLNTAIHDASWGKLLSMLKDKAEKLGKMTYAVNPRNTSQECSQCGAYVKKSLTTRTHSCKTCGYVADRDENAAWNILRLGLESLGLTLEAPTITLCV